MLITAGQMYRYYNRKSAKMGNRRSPPRISTSSGPCSPTRARSGDADLPEHKHKEPEGETRLCAFVAYPFVGHRHADGRLRGGGIALPYDLDPDRRKDVEEILFHRGGLRALHVPALEEPIEPGRAGRGGVTRGTEIPGPGRVLTK